VTQNLSKFAKIDESPDVKSGSEDDSEDKSIDRSLRLNIDILEENNMEADYSKKGNSLVEDNSSKEK
jgi:hypothetical protein